VAAGTDVSPPVATIFYVYGRLLRHNHSRLRSWGVKGVSLVRTVKVKVVGWRPRPAVIGVSTGESKTGVGATCLK
jgi:hypothetical protein